MCRINLLALPGFETRIKRKYSVIADSFMSSMGVLLQDWFTDFTNGIV